MKRFWMLFLCLLLVCCAALAECALCGGDSVCDTCQGNGFLLMKAYGSDAQVQVACTAGCDNGRCPDCAVPCDVCGSDGKCDVCGGLGYVLMQAYGSDEMVQVACMGENCADGACAVCTVVQMVPEPTPKPTPAPSADAKPTSGGMAITHIGSAPFEIDPNKTFAGRVSIAQGNTPQPTEAKKKTGIDLGAFAEKIKNSQPKSMDEWADEMGWEENTNSIFADGSKDFLEASGKKTESQTQSGNTLTIEVFIGDDHRKYTITTNETYVLDALLEEGLVKGEEVSWGFNVTTVDGVKANYNRKGEYWSILEYVDGGYTSLMDSLANRKVRDGDRYAFTLMN